MESADKSRASQADGEYQHQTLSEPYQVERANIRERAKWFESARHIKRAVSVGSAINLKRAALIESAKTEGASHNSGECQDYVSEPSPACVPVKSERANYSASTNL